MERLSEREKEEIVRLSAMGLPSRLIGQQIGRHHRTVWGHLARLRRPVVAEPVRSPLRLSLREREEISRGLAAGESRRSIARRLGRSPSTIAREVARNGDARRYRACTADRAALARARRPKVAKLAACPRLRAVVESKLELRWSPQQISGWLVGEFPDDPEMRVSHETIYLSLFVQARGALRKELTRFLRSKHTTRRPRGHSVMNGQGQLRATLNIRERPAEAERPCRARPLGRRPAHGQTHARDGDPRGTQEPLRDAGRVAERSLRRRRRRRARRRRSPSCPTNSVDRSPGTKAKRWPRTHASPSTPMSPSTSATRAAPGNAASQREHQRAAAPILPEAFRDRALHPGRPRRRRRRTQRQASTNPRLAVTITSTRRSVAMTT